MNHSGKPRMLNDYPNLCNCLDCSCNRKDQCCKIDCKCCVKVDYKTVYSDKSELVVNHHV